MGHLILSGGTLSAYILPELSPANIGKIRDVTDISIDYDELHLDTNERNYITPIDHINGEVFVKVTVFTKKSIRLIRIFDEGMKLFKDVHYPQSIQGIQRSKFAAVGTKTNYDLIDLVQVQKIPLFPVSTVPRDTNDDSNKSEWKPIICPVGKSEFLMTCGGISMDDPSMGMVVNLNGDVSRGTIAWPSYPTSLCVDFPYTITVFSNNELLIHSLHDQSQVQSIRFPKSSIVGVKSGVHIFQSKNSELSHLLTKIPIITESTPEEIQRVAEENDFAFEKYVSNSSCLIYDSSRSSIKLLKPQPKPIRLLHLYETANEHNKQLIFEELADELIEETRSGNEEEKSQIEKEFNLTLLGLLTLKFNMFDQCFEIWGGNLTKLDPRILIYILGNSKDKIRGSLWQFQGLVEKIGELKVQYANEKENEFLKLFLNTCISSESIVNVDVMKTIEICLIETNIDSDDILGILKQIKLSSNDAIEILLFKKKYYHLAKYYEYLKDHHQFLYYWKMLLNGEYTDNEYTKHFEDPKKSLHYLINYLITNCYKDDSTIWKYAEWLLVKYPEFGYLLLTNKSLENISIKDSKVLQLLANEPNIKLNYLKYMITAKNEKQFTGDLILALLSELMKTLDADKEAVEKELNSLHEKYKTLSIPRISLNKYLKLELGRFSNKYLLELVEQLYNFLSLINKDTRCILNQKPVVEECFKALKDKEAIFPMLSIMLHYKKVEYEKIVIMFCEIGDFNSAELFANTLQLPDFRIVNNHTASKKFTQSHNSTMEPPLSSSSNLSITEKVRSEKLLMVIFDKYLEMKNTQLIEMFLNSYNLLKDDDMESGGGSEVDIIYKMNKFIQLLERIPDNFPITQIHTFLIRNMIEFQDAANASILVRNLSRSQTVSLKGLHRDLGS